MSGERLSLRCVALFKKRSMLGGKKRVYVIPGWRNVRPQFATVKTQLGIFLGEYDENVAPQWLLEDALHALRERAA